MAIILIENVQNINIFNSSFDDKHIDADILT